ncbi:hypothetical protein [Mycobacterium sp. 852014-52144_SCH5372336]|uniref:hypothetical protein n=1 Tax=Mycobacterium sp. 852014-52144_SCH5372336 TaxID=1834115 RepID=UPI0018D363D5|nr:hypothetical protein [Mycobacterium sp. 852014-52144_SCH5372336]
MDGHQRGCVLQPLGVRIPHDVRLSITDPIIGHELTKALEEAGGAIPPVVVRQAEAREKAAPRAPVRRRCRWTG